MKIEIKGLKSYAGLSRETLAFTGTLWIDGKSYGAIENDGQGGPDRYAQEAEELLKPYAATLPKEKTEYGEFTVRPDWLISNAVHRAEMERKLKNWLKNRVVIVNGEVCQHTRTLMPQQLQTELKRQWAGTVLNLLPFEQACEILAKCK